jgi:hypothetical protein
MDTSALKVDETSLRLYNSVSKVLFFSNITIPAQYFNDPEVIQRVLNFIQGEFPGQTPVYQICYNCYVRHKKTGEEKFWTGSLFFTENSKADLFQPYKREVLKTRLSQLEEIAIFRASQGVANSMWEFGRLQSAIINLNCQVPANFKPLFDRGLAPGPFAHCGDFARKHVTFPLP